MYFKNFSTLLLIVFLTGCGSNSELPSATDTVTAQGDSEKAVLVNPTDSPNWEFPQRRLIDGGQLVYHAPQIRQWPDFTETTAQMVFEYIPDADPVAKPGTVTFTADTEVDLRTRVVKMHDLKITAVQFAGSVPDTYVNTILNTTTREHLDVPLDLFLSYLATGAVELATTEGFNTEPPTIFTRSTPTILLFVNGTPVFAPLGDSGISVLANANWPTFRYEADGSVYLLNKDVWLSAPSLQASWSAATGLPEAFGSIPDADLQDAIRAAIPIAQSGKSAPAVILRSEPAELILTDGEPVLAEIEGTAGLSYVTNTDSPLFSFDSDWYFLVAGRWFSTNDLFKGTWTYVKQLPSAFQMIPGDHQMASILASVPGTIAAKEAALEALIPIRQEAALEAKAPDVVYAGDPEFEVIPQTTVSRAINTSYDILLYEGKYFLCYSGVWYTAATPIGPWAVTAEIPAAIYGIPPSSPSYYVTQVKVAETTPTSVVYSYPPSYSSNVYVSYGVPVYGTGWYYAPYIYGLAYYPYYTSYGHGNWYNPNTGTYGSRSVAYGPFGGYSYTEGYNPTTGRYGYVETAWDGDEWASYGETYNPRTGVATETSRYYDEDRDQMETEREVSRGDKAVSMERTVDYDEGVAETRRETEAGGSSSTRREFDDGKLTSEGNITGSDGRTATISGEHTREGGTTTIVGSEGGTGTIERDGTGSGASREGSFSKDGQTLNTETERQGTRTRTTLESSSGGQAISVSDGLGRTTVAESASGDLYAGHDGNVYKKTDSGWAKYDDSGWQPVDTPERPTGDGASATSSTTQRQSAPELTQSGQTAGKARTGDVDASDYRSSAQPAGSRSSINNGTTNRSSLNRDFSARQSGYNQFSQRRSASAYGSRSGRGRSAGRRH